jgi:fatty acid desaturase
MSEVKVVLDERLVLERVYHAPWSVPRFEERLSPEKKQILREKIKELRTLKPAVIVFHLIIDWLIIFGAIFLSVWFLPWQLYFVPMIIIASRQHAILVIMHDAVHFTFSRHYKFSDFITNVFAAYPLFITTENFRHSHLLHHRFLNSEMDPDLTVKKNNPDDWTFPKNKKQILKLIGREILGGGFIEILRKLKRFSIKNNHNKEGKLNSNIYLRLGYYFVLFCFLYKFHFFKQYLVFWVLPMLFILPLFLRLRSIGDHFGLPGTDELNSARNLLLPWWQKFLFAPHNIGVHVVHHIYPSIPYYNLLEANDLMLKIDEYRLTVHQNTSVLSFKKSGLLHDLETVKPELKMD